MPEIRIGISGWRYGPWRGVFYPRDLAQKRELEYASRQLNSIEINGSFYSLQTPSSYKTWYEQTPDGFVFAVKGGRYITHMRKLNDIDQPLANFFASGVLRLNEKLGPFLWQFPPFVPFDAEKFENFFALLPRDSESAAKLARKRTSIMKGRTWMKVDENRPLRHAVEFRHASFLDKKFVDLCRRYNIAIVFADTAGLWPYTEDISADFIYIRLHGAEQIYTSGYTEGALDWWAQRIRAWMSGGEPKDAKRVHPRSPRRRKSRDIYAYFDNDVKVKAPVDAMGLAARLNAPPALP